MATPLKENDFTLQDRPLESFGETIPFKIFRGTGHIARAAVEWEFRQPEETTRSAVITHGYGAKEEVYDGFADALAGQGIAVATYKAVRKQSFAAGFHPKHFFHPERLVCQAPWGAIRDIRERDDIEAPTDKFTFVGHSMGGRTAVKNAHAHPDSVEGVILIDAAGIEDHNFVQLLARGPSFYSEEVVQTFLSGDLEQDQAARLFVNSLLYVLNNPARTAGEGISIGNADIKPELALLPELGIYSAVVLSAADKLIYASRALKALEANPHIADTVQVMPDANLGHLGILRQPAKYGSAVLQIIEHFGKGRRPTADENYMPLKAAA